MKLSDKAYNVLKWIALVFVPAGSTFYVVLDKVFGWGSAETVSTIAGALCTFIGALIGVSTAEYNKTK